MSKRFGIVFLIVVVSCTTIRVRYEGEVLATDGTFASKVILERSVPTQGHALACGLSAILYGGWCWIYLAMPMGYQKQEVRDQAQRLMASSSGCVTGNVINEKIKRSGWKSSADQFACSAQREQVAATKGNETNKGKEPAAAIVMSSAEKAAPSTTQSSNSRINQKAQPAGGFGVTRKYLQDRWKKLNFDYVDKSTSDTQQKIVGYGLTGNLMVALDGPKENLTAVHTVLKFQDLDDEQIQALVLFVQQLLFDVLGEKYDPAWKWVKNQLQRDSGGQILNNTTEINGIRIKTTIVNGNMVTISVLSANRPT